MKKLYLMLSLFCVLLAAVKVVGSDMIENKKVLLGAFSSGSFTHWQPQIFSGETLYTFVNDDKKQDIKVLMSESKGTASGLLYQHSIDLEQTPWLNWSWKANTVLTGLDETKKSGDDFIVRLYVIIDGGLFFWKTQALNYVWSSSHDKGESWVNPYTSNASMLAVESGEAALGNWQYYSRNVREDLKHITGKDIRYIDAVAIMTDTDNSQQKAIAYYGDIFFTNKKQISVMERNNEAIK